MVRLQWSVAIFQSSYLWVQSDAFLKGHTPAGTEMEDKDKVVQSRLLF